VTATTPTDATTATSTATATSTDPSTSTATANDAEPAAAQAPTTSTTAGTPITAARLHDARALAPAPTRVNVGEAVEGLRDLLQLANSRGAAHARMVLHPAELGGVEVRLRQSSQGLQATVTAEHPDALASLARGGADLKRDLEARGVTVASLEFSLAPQGDGGSSQRDGLATAFGSAANGSNRNAAGGGDESDDALLLEPTAAASSNLSATTAGSLLDVLA
jgi:flagellar hook-length control protein FliK